MTPAFNMDSSTAHSHEKKRRHGYFLSRRNALLLLGLVLLGLILTAVIAYHAASTTFACQTENDGSTDVSVLSRPTAKIDVRLPRSVVPDRYVIRLIPHLWDGSDTVIGNYTFSGNVQIIVNVTTWTFNITLHALQLDIDEEATRVYELQPDGSLGLRVDITRHSQDVARQFYVLHVVSPLKPHHQYKLHLSYTGSLNDLLQGFYRSSYKQEGDTKWIATTQFQPTDARRAFPCFDEPALKARFRISIARPRQMSAISNMPRIADEPDPVEGLAGWVWDHFEESVPMSTYLVAFVVSDLSRKVNGSFSVWSRRDALYQADYALSVGPPILKYFEQFFQVPFPLPKIDMVALPDFAAGAMENWGLITYRETAMLFEEDVSTSSNKQRVATVVSHELAHQWFGNLVTPAWWTDLWLNEGFASYVEYLGVHAVEPSWQIMEQFVIDEVHNVLALDALESSHPISIVVGHPDEINEIFDRISYGKGASIIRMMDHFLTSTVFTKGLSKYLKNKAFQSATQDDLWTALTNEAHAHGVLDKDVTVHAIMDTWTLQTGFPVLEVTRNYDMGTAVVTQERFLLNPSKNKTQHKEKAGKQPLWWIPITYTTSKERNFLYTRPSLWLKAEPMATISNLTRSTSDWLILNLQETGFYRVNYDPTNWALLIAALASKDFDGIHSINRAQLINDALDLARSGRLNYSIALGVTQYLANELEYTPWKAAFSSLGYVDTMLIKTPSYANFKRYILHITTGLFNHTGLWEQPGEPQLTIYKRVNMLNWLCGMGHENCVQHSVKLFNKWKASSDPDKQNPVPVNLKNVVYCTAIRNGGQAEWEFAWERYLATNVGSEKDILLTALGCTRETWILSRYLLRAVTENSGIRKQDSARVFGAVSSNVIGQALAFNFLRDEWDRLKNYAGGPWALGDTVSSLTEEVTTVREMNELRDFAKLRGGELGTARRAVEQAIERAEANVRWIQQNAGVIDQWLAEAVSAR